MPWSLLLTIYNVNLKDRESGDLAVVFALSDSIYMYMYIYIYLDIHVPRPMYTITLYHNMYTYEHLSHMHERC